MTHPIVIGWLVLAVALASLWLYQLYSKDATSVDVGWAAGLFCLSIYYGVTGEGDLWRRMLVTTMAAVWAGRLGIYLLRNRVLGRQEEDGRYQHMRSTLGPKAQPVFFVFYQLQAAVAVLFSLPIYRAMQGAQLGPAAAVAVLIWVIAVGGEAVADHQLTRFRNDPSRAGQVCRSGLWHYSRHPNYFFEWLHWWSYVLVGGGAAITWIGPIAMLLFLFRVTGIPYTEQQALRSRGEAYREYQRTTSVFFPWPPRAS